MFLLFILFVNISSFLIFSKKKVFFNQNIEKQVQCPRLLRVSYYPKNKINTSLRDANYIVKTRAVPHQETKKRFLSLYIDEYLRGHKIVVMLASLNIISKKTGLLHIV